MNFYQNVENTSLLFLYLAEDTLTFVYKYIRQKKDVLHP